MTIINSKQGAVKASEVSTDNALVSINSGIGEDFDSVTKRLSNVITDSFKRSHCVMMSDGFVTWDSPNLVIPAGVKVTFQVEITDVGAVSKYINCEYLSASSTSLDMTNGLLWIELSRANLNSGTTVTLTNGAGGGGTAGRRFMTGATLPPVRDLNDGNPQTTLSIPIGYKNSTNLYWVLSGQLWVNGTVSQIGINTRIVNVPLGTIVGVHIQSVTDTATINQAYVNTNWPGWWLCDATAQPTISYAGSTLNGQATPPLNNPVTLTGGRDRGRFIRGNATSGTSGGSDLVTLSLAQMPSHYHTIPSGVLGNHTHAIQNSISQQMQASDPLYVAAFSPPGYYVANSGNSGTRVACGAVRSNLTFYRTVMSSGANSATPASGAHEHTLNAQASSGGSHENIPSYRTLVYIMKVL
jgi:hypothetical protein